MDIPLEIILLQLPR